MNVIEYRDLSLDEFDKIKELWEKLKSHHYQRATIFKADFAKITFTERKRKINAGKKEIRIIIASEKDTSIIAGYCISSISLEGTGEIDSLYVDEKHRKLGIGKELMNLSLEWFKKNEIHDIIIGVALGNEEALPFYEKFGFVPRTYILKKKPALD